MNIEEAAEKYANDRYEELYKKENLKEFSDTTRLSDFTDGINEGFIKGAQWQIEQLKAEQEAYKPKVEFYREQTEKLTKYIHENNIGAPCQGFFDVLYDHIQDLKAKLKQTV